MKNSKNNCLTRQIFPTEVLKTNESALEHVEFFKKVADIMERTNLAMGRKASYTHTTGSTISAKIDQNVIISTH